MLTFHTWTGCLSPRVPFSMNVWWFFSGASLFYHLILQFCHVSIHTGVCLLVKVSCPCNFYVRKGLVKQFQMIISGKRNEVSSNLVFFLPLDTYVRTWPVNSPKMIMSGRLHSVMNIARLILSISYRALYCNQDVFYRLFSSTSGHFRFRVAKSVAVAV